MMVHSVELLKERIARTPVNRRGYRQYSRDLRRDLEEHAASRVAQGASYKQIAGELGLAAATLLNWCKVASPEQPQVHRRMGFRPVEMRDERGEKPNSTSEGGTMVERVSRPVVVLPSGVRVEGISLTELPELLRRL